MLGRSQWDLLKCSILDLHTRPDPGVTEPSKDSFDCWRIKLFICKRLKLKKHPMSCLKGRHLGIYVTAWHQYQNCKCKMYIHYVWRWTSLSSSLIGLTSSYHDSHTEFKGSSIWRIKLWSMSCSFSSLLHADNLVIFVQICVTVTGISDRTQYKQLQSNLFFFSLLGIDVRLIFLFHIFIFIFVILRLKFRDDRVSLYFKVSLFYAAVLCKSVALSLHLVFWFGYNLCFLKTYRHLWYQS